jgi:assimilatory nitrate reductase catalytic subunit
MISISPKLPENKINIDYPFVLNTGRMRDQWHTMTRTALVSRLNAHSVEPFVQIHPSDARHLAGGAIAKLVSRNGEMLSRVVISDDQQPGSVFVPMHWNDSYAKSARVGALVAPVTDPISGQPESKYTPIRVELYSPKWQGFALSRNRLLMTDTSYCAVSLGNGYWRHEMAGETLQESWRTWLENNLGQNEEELSWIEYNDAAMGRYRAACLVRGRLEAVFFIARDQYLPDREWLTSLFMKSQLDPTDMAGLLAAKSSKVKETGRTICACFSVGEKTILDTIKHNNLSSVEEVGKHLNAGTNCGSCISEIRSLLTKTN